MTEEERAELRAELRHAITDHYARMRWRAVEERQWPFMLDWCERLGLTAESFTSRRPHNEDIRRYTFKAPGDA